MKNKKINIGNNSHLDIFIIPKEVRCTVFHGFKKHDVVSVNPNHIAAYDNINEFLHEHCEQHIVSECHNYIEKKISLKGRL